MDFARIDLSQEDRDFRNDLRSFLAGIVTEEVLWSVRETGDNFDENVHLALASRGYLERDFRSTADGGFTAVRRRIWEVEIGRSRTPWFHWGTTSMVARSVEKYGSPELVAEVLPGVLAGRIRLCIGYSEPDGGSDVATCKTMAVREGGIWVINGRKAFTANAHNAQFVFLITNTAPEAPKHQSLTMFLVPMHLPGVEVAGGRIIDGDRTNTTIYRDVRVDDKYRVGEVDGGWTVLRDVLDAEHGTVEKSTPGLQKISVMTEHLLMLADAIDQTAADVAEENESGQRLIDDDHVKYRLGRAVARMEAAASSAEMFGRVAITQAMRDVTPDLMDIRSAAGGLPIGSDGETAEYLFRLGIPMGVLGGTLEVFRNMIAQFTLGMGKPNYSPARAAS